MKPVTVTGRNTGPTNPADRRWGLTGAVCTIVLLLSVVALFDPRLMDLFTRNLAELRAGQWWRAFTPVLIQPDGWGQLGFNVLGLALVGTALERRTSRSVWALIAVLGGPGSIFLLRAAEPGGGGSSDAVAALIGAVTVFLAATGDRVGRDVPAQAYAVFFAAYLTALDLAGTVPAIVGGNVAVVAFFAARRAWRPSTLSRACLVLVLAAGVAMTARGDGHGTGILTGAAVAASVLARRRIQGRASGPHPGTQLGWTVLGVCSLTVLGWLGWVRLLGHGLVTRGGPDDTIIGWVSVVIAAIAACLLARLALAIIRRRWPSAGTRIWLGLCAFVTVGSLGGPLLLAVGPTRAALVSLHLICASATVAMLVPTRAAPGSLTEHSADDPGEEAGEEAGDTSEVRRVPRP